MQCHRSGEVLPLPWHCIAVAVGELCHWRMDVHIIYI